MNRKPAEVDSALTVKRETTASRATGVGRDSRRLDLLAVGGRQQPDARRRPRTGRRVGSTIHHSVGVWPLLLDDETVVQDCRAARAAGAAGQGPTVRKGSNHDAAVRHRGRRLSHRDGRGTRRRADGLGAQAGGTRGRLPRNRECTWRLAAIAERRISDDDQ